MKKFVTTTSFLVVLAGLSLASCKQNHGVCDAYTKAEQLKKYEEMKLATQTSTNEALVNN